MSATPEMYKGWRNRAKQGTLYFCELLEEMPKDNYFAFGCQSNWIFIGTKAMFEKDMDFLDELYYENSTNEAPHILFLMKKVEEVNLRHWDNEHLLILIKLEGAERGFLAFEKEYKTFIEECKARRKAGLKLPKEMHFDRQGNICKKMYTHLEPDNTPKQRHSISVIRYDKNWNMLDVFSSMEKASKASGISWHDLKCVIQGKKIHPKYNFKLIKDGTEQSKDIKWH